MSKKRELFWVNPRFRNKMYRKTMGFEIADLRRRKGWAVSDCLIKLDIEKHDYDQCVAIDKTFRKSVKIGNEAALDWWKAELGRCASQKRGDVRGIEQYLLMEFGYKIDLPDVDEKFGFIVKIRKRNKKHASKH